MEATATLYRSDTDPNKGWWVASVPTGPSSFRVVRVLRDSTGGKTQVEALTEVQAVLPTIPVEAWRPRGDQPKVWEARIEVEAVAV